MNTVLRVDLKSRLSIFFDHLVHPRRTVTLRRLVESRQIVTDRNFRIRKREVTRLVLFVIGVRSVRSVHKTNRCSMS